MDFFIKFALAKSIGDPVGEFSGEEIYRIADNLGWIGDLVKGLFWVVSLSIIIILAVSLNSYSTRKKSQVFRCPKCGYSYKEKEWAKKCEAWCTIHKTCNLEINKHRVMVL